MSYPEESWFGRTFLTMKLQASRGAFALLNNFSEGGKMTFGLLLKELSLFLSIWAIHYYFKTQPPLDRSATFVRWVGFISCVAIWFLMLGVLRLGPNPKLWIHEHHVLFVLVFGPPSFACGAFLLLPGFSRGIAAQLKRWYG